MTTQELKQYIDNVLGNSIRCLLPSYWWKRVFGMVVDEVDRVEQKVNTKVDKSYVDEALSNVSTDEASLVFTLYTDVYGNVSETDEEIYQNALSVLEYLDKAGPNSKKLVLKWGVKENNKILYFAALNPPLVGRGFTSLAHDGICFYDVDFGDGALGGVLGNKDVIFDSDGKATIVPHFGVNEANFIVARHSNAGTLSSRQKEQNKRMHDILSKTTITQLPIFVYLEFNAGFTTIPVAVSKGAPEDSTAFLLQGLQHEFYIFMLQSDGNVTLLSNEPLVPSYDTSLSETSTNAVQNKAIKSYVDNAVANVTVDTSELATKEEVSSLVNELIDDEEVLAHSLNELKGRIDYLSENVSGKAVSKEELVQTVEDINKDIIDDEEVLAYAINDLNNRMIQISKESTRGGGVVIFPGFEGETQSEEEKAKSKAAYEAFYAASEFPTVLFGGGDKSEGFELMTPSAIIGKNGDTLTLSFYIPSGTLSSVMYVNIEPDGTITISYN